MPLRNRVTPLGELVADRSREALVFGNRGCLVDARGELRRSWQVRRWIACRLAFKGRRRAPLMQPGRYTELFFLDDATAMAAGHRACAECRREDFRTVQRVLALDRVGPLDDRLHAERVGGGGAGGGGARRLHDAPWRALPDGAFVLLEGAPWLVVGRDLRRWAPAGYTDRRARPVRGEARAITPPLLLELLDAGWDPVVPLLHPSAAE